ncbi:MAG: DUF2333 family protein [Pseudomonadota bacterium]
MLDPLFDVIAKLWRGFIALFKLRLPKPEEGGPEKMRGMRATGRIAWRGGLLIFVILFLIWNITFFWHVLWTRGDTLAYPQDVLRQTAMVDAGQTTSPDGGGDANRTCDRSQIVDMQIYLLDLMVNRNEWVPSMPQYKVGIAGIVEWEATPFFDNKAAFQTGVLIAMRRTAVELVDVLGRERGTSGADEDLDTARGRLQSDEQLWWFNPFDDRRPFGPVQPASRLFAGAIPLYADYNDRLEACDALFDARADNLIQFLDRVARDIGSSVDQLSRRSTGRQYDASVDAFVPGEGNDRGWFDFRADNLFMEAKGQMFAYHGLLQAAREDFSDVVAQRNLDSVWDRMEQHIAEAAALNPLIVSNGREDGVLMPDHLSIMSENILRARTNMSEIRDILQR